MSKFRTHYDNLKVARNAPPEVIAAAYRAISRRLHPDVNSQPDAAKLMSIVNASYAVLSDPVQRAQHDDWIAAKEAADIFVARRSSQSSQDGAPAQKESSMAETLRGIGLLVAIGVFALWLVLSPSTPPAPSGLPTYDRDAKSELAVSAPTQAPAYVRPATAPNGSPWPTQAGYVAGYKRLRSDGLSELTVDNSSNQSDKFVKLVAIDGAKTMPIRHFFIPAGASFTVGNIRAGFYDLRYMDLSDGSLTRSEKFELKQVEDMGGVSYSKSTVTLYSVQGGNFQSYGLNPGEF